MAALYHPVSDAGELQRLVRAEDTRALGAGDGLELGAARVARSLLAAKRRVIGLYPASPQTKPYEIAGEIARAIAVATTSIVVVLDPERVGAAGVDATATPVSARLLSPGVVALVPFDTAPPGAKVEVVKVLLHFVEQERSAFEIVLIDLSGCARPGELLGVQRLLDGIVVVGRSGRVDEAELKRASASIPRDLDLGVVLAE
ncbi:MAG: hypothetical protein U0271_19005 [Polyangiaceae bacterium]